MKLSYNFLCVLLLLFISCKNDTQPNEKELKIKQLQLENKLVEYNAKWIDIENDRIANYLKKKNWTMLETGTGLRWQILKNGDGKSAQIGTNVVIKYKVFLIDDTEIYSSDNLGYKSFVVGRSNVESGLEEGILFLKVGDIARFILPSHLAFGLIGDKNKIPEKASLIYELELIKVE